MKFLYNPLESKFNKKGGAIKRGLLFSVKVDSSGNRCNLILIEDKSNKKAVYEMDKINGGFKLSVKGLKNGLYFYCFECDGIFYGRDDFLNAKSYKNYSEVCFYQLTVYSSCYNTPNWLTGGIIYQIFPDRFNKVDNPSIKNKPVMRNWGEQPYYKPNKDGKILNNDFFGGNFLGIKEKLPYLKSLGVTAIYLNPISSSYSNHRYDTSNYLELDSLLGSEEDFLDLVNSAEKEKIAIIFDGVYNHTGDDSLYFNKYGNFDSVGAYQSKNSPYYDWYTFENYPDDYTCWWGINVLPTINKNSKNFEDFILNKVLPKYFNFGLQGVRLDVVDELPASFVKKIRRKVKNLNKNAVIIGEVWEDATNKIAYSTRREYFQGGELDSVMNYPLKNAIIDYLLLGNSSVLAKTVLEQINNYPKQSLNLLMNVLGTHDTARILTVLSGKPIPKTRQEQADFTLTETERNLAISRLKIAFAIAYTIYGVPSVYYGDEIGLEGCKDPFNRCCMNFDSANREILSFVKLLGKIRTSNSVFSTGSVKVLSYERGVFSFKRYNDLEEITVIVNAGNENYNVYATNCIELLTNQSKSEYSLDKYSVLILKRRDL